MANKLYKSKYRGFTIIELLVGIVVIGILVGIVTVSFTSITKQTRQSALENALIETASKVRGYNSINSALLPSLDDLEINENPDLTITYSSSGYPNFCLQGTAKGVTGTFKIDNTSNSIVSGTCPLTPPSTVSPIQTITKTNCPILRTLTYDKRDNHTYWIQKLADGNCWMITNLAYAGGTENGGANTYNDVIPKGTGSIGTLGGPANNTARTYINANYFLSDMGEGYNDFSTLPTQPSLTNQVGYLYNWCAAMGSQNTAACANNTTPSPDINKSICPAGWRLPGGSQMTGEYMTLNSAINGGSTTSVAGLINNPANLQMAGMWSQGFNGGGGYYWTSTQYGLSNAINFTFYPGFVGFYTQYDFGKPDGLSVRCVAN